MVQISKAIVRLRKENNMSQEDMANQLNVSRQAVSKWERGESLPDIENISALAKLFSVSIDSLVNDVADENIGNKDEANRIFSPIWKNSLFLIAVILYFVIGAGFGQWNYAWVAFLLIPILYTVFK